MPKARISTVPGPVRRMFRRYCTSWTPGIDRGCLRRRYGSSIGYAIGRPYAATTAMTWSDCTTRYDVTASCIASVTTAGPQVCNSVWCELRALLDLRHVAVRPADAPDERRRTELARPGRGRRAGAVRG